jgi:hypothetical protein
MKDRAHFFAGNKKTKAAFFTRQKNRAIRSNFRAAGFTM